MKNISQEKNENQIINIYQKIKNIQTEITELKRTELNKFQNYKYFDEEQLLGILKPLLDKYNLVLFLDDNASENFTHEREGTNHFVKYLKKLVIIDCDSVDFNNVEFKSEDTIAFFNKNRLEFSFWACGQNNDLAKAKGAAETYAVKYLLSKFFLIPVKDSLDPDKGTQYSQYSTFKK